VEGGGVEDAWPEPPDRVDQGPGKRVGAQEDVGSGPHVGDDRPPRSGRRAAAPRGCGPGRRSAVRGPRPPPCGRGLVDRTTPLLLAVVPEVNRMKAGFSCWNSAGPAAPRSVHWNPTRRTRRPTGIARPSAPGADPPRARRDSRSAGLGHDLSRLRRREVARERGQAGAGRQEAEGGGQVGEAVRRHEPDPLAGLDTLARRNAATRSASRASSP